MIDQQEIKEIITKINISNKNIVFSEDDFKNIIDYIIKTVNNNNLNYYNHGGSCLCFIDKEEIYIYKVVLKKKSKNFLKYKDILIKSSISTSNIVEILYNDDDYIIYKQKYCRSVRNKHKLFIKKIFDVIKKMFENKIIVSDIFYLNFGLLNNNVVLYDYHEIELLDDILEEEYKFFCRNIVYNIAIAVSAEFSFSDDLNKISDKLNNVIKNIDNKEFIDVLHKKNIDSITEYLDKYINYFSNNRTDYDIYQKITTNDGNISLDKHTFEKYNFVKKYLPNQLKNDINSILDAGCCIGGIGLKLCQEYKNICVTLNNITESEINYCNIIADEICVSNFKINTENIFELNSKHDLTLYYSILHHIIKNYDFNTIINMVKRQTTKYTVIEIPVFGDVLLNKIMSESTDKNFVNFRYLLTIDILVNKLKEHFEVLKYEKMDYGTAQLVRYAILCKLF